MSTPDDQSAKRQRTNKLILWLVGGAVTVTLGLMVLGFIVQALGLNKKESTSTAAQSSSTTSAPAASTQPTTDITTPAALPTTTAAPPMTTTRTVSQPFGPSDQRCTPAAQSAVDAVTAGLSKAGNELRNGTVITSGNLTFFGASIFDSTGKMKERSDVWVIKSGNIYASTGGARNNTTFPKATAAPLNIAPDDEIVQAVDNCVINLTTS